MKLNFSVVINDRKLDLAKIIQDYHLEDLTKDELLYLTFKDIVKRSNMTLSQFCIARFLNYSAICNLIGRKPNHSFLQILEQYYSNCSPMSYHYHCGVAVDAICLKYSLNYRIFCDYYRLGKSFEECLGHAILAAYCFPISIVKKIIHIISDLIKMDYLEFKAFCMSESVSEEFAHCLIQFYRKLMQVRDAINAYYIVDYVTKKTKTRTLGEKQTKPEVLENIGLTEEQFESYYQEFYSDFESSIHNGEQVWHYSRRKYIY